MSRQTVLVDIPVKIPEELVDLSKAYKNVLLNIESLFNLQQKKELFQTLERSKWHEIPKLLRAAKIPCGQENRYEVQIRNLEKGIYDLYPVKVESDHGGADLIIGKVFASEGDSASYYAGVAGLGNTDFLEILELYDSRLDALCDKLTPGSKQVQRSIKEIVPAIRCIDVFSLAGGLDVAHKPICIFFSGKNPENISSLSHMTVFINLYTARFIALSLKLADRFIGGAEILQTLSDAEIAKLLLIWLRGHDVGHFIGEDRLGENMSEFDKDYMVLHELKSDMIGLYSFKNYEDDLLSDGYLEKIYFLTLAEMLRYMRRGDIKNHPDSASAYIAWRFFESAGAINYNKTKQRFEVDLQILRRSVPDFTKELLNIFAEGKPDNARKFVEKYGNMDVTSKNDPAPADCTNVIRDIINNYDIPHYIDYNFITDLH